MKKLSAALRSVLPLLGLIMCSCETSGQLLTVDSGMGMAVGSVAVGIIAFLSSKFQQKQVVS